MLKRVALIVPVVFLFVACVSSNIFPPIGTNLGNPLTLAVNSATARLYVNNSNDKDLYNEGSIQVYNIATPAAPALVGTQATLSFSGEMYLDAVNQFLYTPNRYPTGALNNVNNLLQVNVNEAATGFLTVGTTATDTTPFGAACCDPGARLLVPTLSGTLVAATIGAGAPALTSYNLTTTASDATLYTNPPVSQLAIIGAQAFVTMPANNILVVNLDKLGASDSPVDYVITNVISPRGIATDGTLLYVLATQTVSGNTVPQLLILNPATLTALPAGNTQATNVDVATIQQAALTMGLGTTATDPEQVVVGTNYVFVTNTGDDLVTVVNRVAQTVNTNITVGDQPFGLGLYSPAGVDTTLYVANQVGNSISIIDIATLAVSATFTGP